MRKIIGTILVLYSLLLGLTVSLPLVASIVGPAVVTVTVGDPAACHGAVGVAPLAGLPARCGDVTWTTDGGERSGTLVGKAVDDVDAGLDTPSTAVHQLGDYALTAPDGDAELAMAFLAPPILFVGLHALAKRKRRRRRRFAGFGGDGDDDYDGGDGGGDSDGGGGD